MIDKRHMPAMPMDYVTVSGANGLDDVRVSLSDPLSYVQTLLDDRTVAMQPFDTSNEIVAPPPASVATTTATDYSGMFGGLEKWWDDKMKAAAETAKGAAVAVLVGLIGLIILIFGLYYLVKKD